MHDDQQGGSWTAVEIRQQPEVWRQVARTVQQARAGIDRVLGEALTDRRTRFILTGAGTSAAQNQLPRLPS
ncbi:hypothetical protein [Amycolatopsis sp. cmx-4-68]|uniref:hypothetical protein n=1 Tax=Amycolatopsis sp. cmx-4-68 TaxID=2790938 RepID=UPI003977F0E9